MKYPIGIQSFAQIIEDGYLYFDKTALVYDLVHNGKVYFLSRPRRFGKSLLVSTLDCYFHGRKELFRGLAIDQLETEWLEYPVFRIDFNGNNFRDPNALESTLRNFVANAERQYGKDEFAETIGDRFCAVLATAHRQTGRRAVVLVDEYDKPLLDVMGLPNRVERNGAMMTVEEINRDTLKSFYSTFKAADDHLQFVLLTGVTKFSQISVFSGFNQPRDISMDEHYESICGITKDELFLQLDAQISQMATRYKVSADEMKQKLTKRYDGYHFSSHMTDMFNPFSILNAFAEMKMEDYWFRTGSPTYLVRLLATSNNTLDEYTRRYQPTSSFIDYKADKERPLPMIYQSGYLTIKDYDADTASYLLDFPNDEVKSGFVTLVAADYLHQDEDMPSWTLDVVRTMKQGDMQRLEDLFTSFFASIPYSLRDKQGEREKEKHFQYTFYLVMRMISAYTVYVEKQQSQGRLDCVVETPAHIYIIEFKRDASAREALDQIHTKGYAREYLSDPRALHLLGINFSSQTGTIDGWLAE